MKTWVRTDGVILRQEVPFPFVRLVLERRPEADAHRPTTAKTGNARLMIELRGVTKRFGSKCAVDRLDLEVRPGELFAFLGPNGAGKTTTIKMVCGLLAPNAGHGPGRRLRRRRASRHGRLLGYVPDQPYLYDKLTGREFLRFVVEMYGLDRPRAAQRIDELIETFEMGDYVDELCENYSQGMKQRVVFASALVHDPKVLVVDEPLVGPRPAQRPDRQGPVRRPGPVGLRGADVDPPAGDRRGAGRQDRHRRPRPDAGRRARSTSSAARSSIAGRSKTSS